MRKACFSGLVLLTLTAVPAGVSPAVIINGSTQGLYNAGLGTLLDTNNNNAPFPCANVGCGDLNLTFPTEPNLSTASGPLGNWLTTPNAPGGSWGGPQAIPATWAVNTETAIIYTIDAQGGITNTSLLLGVDNGIFVWLDGVYKFGARAGGGASLGEYQPLLGDLSAGTHYLQILREDHGAATGYLISLTGEIAQVRAVPEPASLMLLTIALIAMTSIRLRRPR
jgi:hypothetical protein